MDVVAGSSGGFASGVEACNESVVQQMDATLFDAMASEGLQVGTMQPAREPEVGRVTRSASQTGAKRPKSARPATDAALKLSLDGAGIGEAASFRDRLLSRVAAVAAQLSKVQAAAAPLLAPSTI